MKTSFLLCPWLLLLLLSATACKDSKEPEPDEQHQAITTVVLRLDPQVTTKGQSVTATWRDADGPGGQDPVKETVALKPNLVYNATLTFLNESQPGQPVDLTAEIREKGSEHQVFFVVAPPELLTIQATDRDSRNLPIGLSATVSTEEVMGAGTVRVVLKHQPRLKSGSSTINTGETDVDVVFDTIVQD